MSKENHRKTPRGEANLWHRKRSKVRTAICLTLSMDNLCKPRNTKRQTQLQNYGVTNVFQREWYLNLAAREPTSRCRNESENMAYIKIEDFRYLTNTTPFSNFHCHRSRNNIPGSKIFSRWSISFHKSLTLAIPQNTTFTTGSWS